ncbi:hypothetical protein M0802_000803 [Mischocyttarus mexicanus]|nr:hypothetical protein M0802_000803 [Mischocyttarus mexicanus]
MNAAEKRQKSADNECSKMELHELFQQQFANCLISYETEFPYNFHRPDISKPQVHIYLGLTERICFGVLAGACVHRRVHQFTGPFKKMCKSQGCTL